MKGKKRIWGVQLMIGIVASFAAAFEGPSGPVAQQGAPGLQAGPQDVITASDAGGGYLTTRDIILVVVIVFAVIGLIAVL